MKIKFSNVLNIINSNHESHIDLCLIFSIYFHLLIQYVRFWKSYRFAPFFINIHSHAHSYFILSILLFNLSSFTVDGIIRIIIIALRIEYLTQINLFMLIRLICWIFNSVMFVFIIFNDTLFCHLKMFVNIIISFE